MSFSGFRRSMTGGAVALGFAGSVLTASKAQAALVFDDVSNGENLTATTSTPNTFMGDGYELTPGTTDITGFDLFPLNTTGTNYTSLKLTIYVWGTVNGGTTSATNPAFSNLLAAYSLTSAGTFTSGFFYPFTSATPGVTPGITLGTPLVIPTSDVGLTFAYQGSTDGVTYASANNLTSAISYGTAPAVGGEDFNGYYRNAAGETNGNFVSTVRSLSVANQSLAARVYGDVSVPEPTSASLAAAGALALARRRRTA